MYIRVSLLSLLLISSYSIATLKVELAVQAEENEIAYPDLKETFLAQENVPTHFTIGGFTIFAKFHGEGETMVDSYFEIHHGKVVLGEPSTITPYDHESYYEFRDDQARGKMLSHIKLVWRVHKLGN